MGRFAGEIVVSMWGPQCLTGNAVEEATTMLVVERGWRVVSESMLSIESIGLPFDITRDSLPLVPRSVSDQSGEPHIPLASELAKNEEGKRGVQRTCLVEYATSVIPCALGLHALDIRFVIPKADIHGWAPDDVIRRLTAEAVDVSRSIVELIDPCWILFSISGRGPSVAELYRQTAKMEVARAYLSKQAAPGGFGPAVGPGVTETEAGWEVAFSPYFGGPTESVQSASAEVMRVVRKATLPLVPWSLLSSLGG